MGNLLDAIKNVQGVEANQGTLTLALGNPEAPHPCQQNDRIPYCCDVLIAQAIVKNSRGSSDFADLNRSFAKNLLAEPLQETPEAVRAALLAPLLADCDICIDLHATNKPSVPFIRIGGEMTPRHTAAIRWLRSPVLLKDPHHTLAGEPVTTDEYVGRNGGVGICFETGHAEDVSLVSAVTKSMIQLLVRECNLFGGSQSPVWRDHIALIDPEDHGSMPRETYEMRECFRLTEHGFRWAQGVGGANFDFIPAGSPVGYIQDRVFSVDYDSYLIFPKVESLWRVGAPLGWLASKEPNGNSNTSGGSKL